MWRKVAAAVHGGPVLALLALVSAVAFGGYIVLAERGRATRLARPRPIESKLPLHPVSLVGAEVRGSRTATVALVVYSDFVCPSCITFATDRLKGLESSYVATGKVLLAMRHAPVTKLDPVAVRAARAAFCAGGEGRFGEVHQSIYRNYGRSDRPEGASRVLDLGELAGLAGLTPVALEKCLESETSASRVHSDAGSALAVGIEVTPSFLVGLVQPRGRVSVLRHFRGLPPEAMLNRALDDLLNLDSGDKPRK